jgi:hypothetical protein
LAAIVEVSQTTFQQVKSNRQTKQLACKRTLHSRTGANLGAVRDRIFDKAKLQRHHVVLVECRDSVARLGSDTPGSRRGEFMLAAMKMLKLLRCFKEQGAYITATDATDRADCVQW